VVKSDRPQNGDAGSALGPRCITQRASSRCVSHKF